MQAPLVLNHPTAQQYFDRLQQALNEQPDGSWFGRQEHQQACHQLYAHGAALAPALVQVLEQSPSILLRSEAIRLASMTNLQQAMLPALQQMLEVASFRPILGRKLEALYNVWTGTPLPNPSHIANSIRTIEHHLWLGMPGQAEVSIAPILEQLASLGEPGLFAIDQMLGHIIEEGYLMSQDILSLFQKVAEIFVQNDYFEGVQIFFDFLAECAPVAPQKEDLSAIGAVLKAVRKLRPYRYPHWSMPLKDFVAHFQSIKQHGRAVEANMLIILITASSIEETLLLEDDEIVDLLRGRRDSAYTEEELQGVAELCDGVFAANRSNARMYHIRGWLAARLDGPEAAEPFFKKAIALDSSYVYPHLALSAIYEMRGEDGSRDHHLSAACQAEPSQISCHRKYGEILQQQGRHEEALGVYERGTQIKPDQVTVLELEEYFGCIASIARYYEDQGLYDQAIQTLNQVNPEQIEATFTARFCERKRVILDLLRKGLKDYQAEIQRAA